MPPSKTRKSPTRRSVSEAQLRGYQADLAVARIERESQESRRAALIADEIQHEQERKRASSDEARVFPFYSSVAPGSVRSCMEMLGEWSRLDVAKSQPFTIE